MKFRFITFLLLTLLIVFIIITPIDAPPEIFLNSWLATKGLVPFKDYFDTHGFLTPFLLAPLTLNISFIYLKAFFLILMGYIFLLLAKIIQPITAKSGYALTLFLYSILACLVTQNSLYYDSIIAALYLTAYWLISKNSSLGRNLGLGVLVAAAATIKPTAAILLIPIFILTHSFVSLLPTLFAFAILGLLYSTNNSIPHMIDGFAFVGYVGKVVYQSLTLESLKYIIFSIIIGTVPIFCLLKLHVGRRNLAAILFLLSSYIFVLHSLPAQSHYLPILVFSAILLASCFSQVKRNAKAYLVFVVMVVAVSSLQFLNEFRYFSRFDQVWWERNNLFGKNVAETIVRNHIPFHRVYAFNNYVEIYIYLNQLPPTYYPLVYPTLQNYDPKLEDSIISDLIKNRVDLIVDSKDPDPTFSNMPKMRAFISKNYYVAYNKDGIILYFLNSQTKRLPINGISLN